VTDDESSVKPSVEDRELLLYDYFKWLTTLSLLTLGGVLSLSQSAELDMDNFRRTAMLAPICLAGITALTAADGIVRVRAGGKPPRLRPQHAMRLSLYSLSLGVGAFLSLFWDVLE
jgi:hypothetical protein